MLFPLSWESSSRGLDFWAQHGHSYKLFAQAPGRLLWEEAEWTQSFPLTPVSLARDPHDPRGHTTEEQWQAEVELVVTVSPWPDLHRPIKSISGGEIQQFSSSPDCSSNQPPLGTTERDSAKCKLLICSVCKTGVKPAGLGKVCYREEKAHLAAMVQQNFTREMSNSSSRFSGRKVTSDPFVVTKRPGRFFSEPPTQPSQLHPGFYNV